jgi:hypothetical protein
MTLVERAIQLSLASKHENIPMEITLGHMINITQVAHVALSSLINIFATSIITLKAWCVRVYGVSRKHFVECALIDDTTCAYVQEIPQVHDGKQDRYPNPWTDNHDIGYSG